MKHGENIRKNGPLKDTIRRFIIQLIPPLLFDTYRKITGRPRTWAGVFPHYRDIQIAGDGYENDWYCGVIREQTQEALSLSEKYGTIPTGIGPEHRLLSLLVSTLSQEKAVKILDFGGGAGIAYIHLANCTFGQRNIDYHVVEGKRLAHIGADLFKDDSRIHFHTELPLNLKNVDIIYLRSVLEYIEDYPGLIKSLSAYKAKYILFTLLMAGDILTCATAQINMPDIRLGAWFFNVREIIDIMSENGYSLIFKAPYEFHTKQDKFPEEYRLKCPCSLLFVFD